MEKIERSSVTDTGTLLPFIFAPLPLGSIKPRGWLHDQLQTMARGLAGYEHDFYRIVRNSRWLGGDDDYSDLNEAMPYWFNGLVPLAYQLEDNRLVDQVESVAKEVLARQQDDGWLGPESELNRRNFWGRTPMVLGLVQMAEARAGNDLAGQIADALHRYVDLMHSMLADDLQGLVAKPGDDFEEQWGRSRAADSVMGLQWLFEKDPRDKRDMLLECMGLFKDGAYDWSEWFSEDMYIKGNVDDVPSNITDELYHFLHGVNAGQGLKSGAVIRRFTHNDGGLESVYNGVNWTFKYHGTPSGAIIADERLSGLSPVRGVELCSVVETMYSLTYLHQSLGDGQFADRCELAAFNALPIMLTADAWAHQYVAETNQPVSHELDDPPFYNVGNVGQTFGLEPNYPCCTVNHPQGYPKFVSNMFSRTHSADGIVHALLGPGSVNTTTTSGVNVTITCDTNYPFGDVLHYNAEADDAFTLHLRVPSWADMKKSWFSVDDEQHKRVRPNQDTGMQEIHFAGGKHAIVYSITGAIRVESRANDTVSIYRGPVLYSIPVDSDVTSTPSNYTDAPPSAREYTMTPTSKWGLAVDPSTLKFNPLKNADAVDHTLPDPLWARDADLPSITASVCEIKWELTGPQGYAPDPPGSGQRDCIGEPYEVEMVPYGTARLHMAELPVVDLAG